MIKEDLKNVVITFGLIALVFTQGSLAYQKKINKDYILATIQQSELQKTKKDELVKAEQARILNEQELLIQQIEQDQLTIQNTQNKTSKNQTDKKAQADLLVQQKRAQALLEKQAAAKLLAQQKAAAALAEQQATARALAQAEARAAATQSSRQSRAS